MRGYLGQFTVFILGLFVELAVPVLLSHESQRKFVRILGFVLIACALLWGGYELGLRQALPTVATDSMSNLDPSPTVSQTSTPELAIVTLAEGDPTSEFSTTISETSPIPLELPTATAELPLVTATIPQVGTTASDIPDWVRIHEGETIEQWLASCIQRGLDGHPAQRISSGGNSSICSNQAFNQVLDDFIIEWTVRLDGRAALLTFGMEDDYYLIILLANEGQLSIKRVQDGKSEDRGFFYVNALQRDPFAINEVSARRIGSEIILSVNGEGVTTITDELFNGEAVPIKVTFGGASKDTDSMVQLEKLNIYVPQE